MMYATLELGLKNGKEFTCEFGARAEVVGEGEESRLQSFIVWTVSSFIFNSDAAEEKGSGSMTDLRTGLGAFEGSDARLVRRIWDFKSTHQRRRLPVLMIQFMESFFSPCYIQPEFFIWGREQRQKVWLKPDRRKAQWDDLCFTSNFKLSILFSCLPRHLVCVNHVLAIICLGKGK